MIYNAESLAEKIPNDQYKQDRINSKAIRINQLVFYPQPMNKDRKIGKFNFEYSLININNWS